MRKRSLAAQLALLNDVAPTADGPQDLPDFPSRSRNGARKEVEEDAEELDNGEEDGQDGEGEDQGSGSEEDGDSGDGSQSDDMGDGTDGSSIGGMDEAEDDLEAETENDEDEDADGHDESENDQGTGDEDGSDGSRRPGQISQADEEVALIKSLKAENAAQAQRGRAIKRQQREWDSILELRIRAQKVVRGAMRIDPSSINALLSQAGSQADAQVHHASLLKQLDALSASLFVLRARMLQQTRAGDVSLPDELSVGRFEAARERARKRLRRDAEDDEESDSDAERHNESVKALLDLDSQVVQPLASLVLTSAHQELNVGAPSAASKGTGPKFSNASTAQATPVEQIEATFSNPEAKRRLVERTQVWRGDETLLGAARADAADASAIAKSGRELKADIYDDSDMYSHLLRELIESKGGRPSTSAAIASSAKDGGAGAGFNADLTLLAPALLNGGRKAAKRAVDTRASKGRKIRYEVHDKIANFMPPVPRLLWDEEQIDRLFAKLNTKLGDRDIVKRSRASSAVANGMAEEDGGEADDDGAAGGEQGGDGVVIDGLQLFG